MSIVLMEKWSVEDVRRNPNWLFVFGDNLIRRGTGGQAVIRDEPNAFGIPTKRLPSMGENSFFSDRDDERRILLGAIRKLYVEQRHYDAIVFPLNGLGIGLAKMKEKSPKLFREMNSILKKHFGVTFP